MERIQVDFAIQRGHEMIVQRDPPFARAELDEVDMQMLQAERPPGLLPVDWFEMDGSVTFRYAIDGRKLLPHRLITGPFGMNEYISLMLGIVEALDNCGHYLLRESCCLLEEKFLFVGGDWRDAALTYVPLREPPSKKPAREELLGLAVRLMGKMERVDGEVMQAVLRLLDDPAASWSKIRVGLLQMLASEQRSDPGSPDLDGERASLTAFDALSPDTGWQQTYDARNAVADRSGYGVAPKRMDSRFGKSAEWRNATDDGEQPGGTAKNRFDLLGKMMRRVESADAPPPETSMFDDREWPGTTGRIRDSGRARWLSACGAVLAAALIWRYIYLPSPGTDRLLISLGATLLVGGGLFLLWQRLDARNHRALVDAQSAGESRAGASGDGFEAWRPETESGGQSGDAAELRFPWLTEFARDNHGSSDAAFAPRAVAIGADVDKDAGIFTNPEAGSAANSLRLTGADMASVPGMSGGADSAGIPGMSGAAGLTGASGMMGAAGLADEETGLLEDETVLLGQDGEERQGGKFWLVREHEGQHRRIPVEPGTQVIGRSEAHARIVDTAEGVSRAHLEIGFDGAEVRIKDLASRNGTLLGGEIMVPYKEYVLRGGGEFRLAGPDGPKYTLRRGG